mgnify:CR=1 FL=1
MASERLSKWDDTGKNRLFTTCFKYSTPALRPQHPGRMGLVQNQSISFLLAISCQCSDVRTVAFHGKNSLGNDVDLRAFRDIPSQDLREARLQGLQVVVVKFETLCLSKGNPIPDTGMDRRVIKYVVVPLQQGG